MRICYDTISQDYLFLRSHSTGQASSLISCPLWWGLPTIDMSHSTNEELETFRKRWKEEVTARSRGDLSSHNNPPAEASGSDSSVRKPPQYSRAEEITAVKEDHEDQDVSVTRTYHDLEDKDDSRRLGTEGQGIHPSTIAAKKLSTALDHYEKAVEREEQGKLGDSVSLYRKAYKLDAGVDKAYRNKHFPPSTTKSKPTTLNPSNAPVTVPNTAHHSLDGSPASNPTTSELIASFAGLAIPTIPPETDHSPQPPYPIATIPSELLVEILRRLAVTDIASFTRLSLVCKHLAYLVATEDRIWARICLGPEYGFAGMHYTWACSISGAVLPFSIPSLLPDLSTLTLNPTPTPTTPLSLHLSSTKPT